MLCAADCAEHVLPYFEENYPDDDRPRNALEPGRPWARGEIACEAPSFSDVSLFGALANG